MKRYSKLEGLWALGVVLSEVIGCCPSHSIQNYPAARLGEVKNVKIQRSEASEQMLPMRPWHRRHDLILPGDYRPSYGPGTPHPLDALNYKSEGQNKGNSVSSIFKEPNPPCKHVKVPLPRASYDM